MQSGWVGEVAGLFFFWISKAASRHNCSSKLGKFCSRFAFAFTAKIVSICADEVGTSHPIFSFFDSPCLRHRVLHNGSFCQLPDGKPSAPRSTSGYSAKSACILSSMSFPGDMILRKYLMMHISKYTLNGSV